MRMLASGEAMVGIALVELGLVIVPGPNMIYLVLAVHRAGPPGRAEGQGPLRPRQAQSR